MLETGRALGYLFATVHDGTLISRVGKKSSGLGQRYDFFMSIILAPLVDL